MLRRLVLMLSLVALARNATAETVTIDQVALFFTPNQVVIHPGDTVRWQWHSANHTVTEGTDGLINGNELFTSALNSSVQTFQFTFTPAFLAANPHPGGRYDYFCQIHFAMGMTGVIFVADPPPGTEFCAGNGSGTACPCGNSTTLVAGCVNTSGLAGRLRATGMPSVSADTLRLFVSGMPEGGSVLFFQGTTQVNGGAGAVFGDGLRCAGGTSIRLGFGTISFGFATYPQGGSPLVSVKGLVPAGATRTYQVFYRDPPSTCTGAAFNTSDGYSVNWQP